MSSRGSDDVTGPPSASMYPCGRPPPCKNSLMILIGSLAFICRACWYSHLNAGQDGFRDVGSKQGGGYIGPLAHTGCPTSRIDRSHHLQVSCKFTYRPSTVASLSCSPWLTDFFTLRKPRLAAQQCFYRPRSTSSFSTRSWRSCWPTRRLRVSAACA